MKAERAEFAAVDPSRLAFLEENGMSAAMGRTRGRTPVGKRVDGPVPHDNGKVARGDRLDRPAPRRGTRGPGRGLDETRLLAGRAERSQPTPESFGAWPEGEANKVLLTSPIGEAMACTRSNRVALTRHLEAPYLPIDNSAVENAIRPIAAGRKNWSHSG